MANIKHNFAAIPQEFLTDEFLHDLSMMVIIRFIFTHISYSNRSMIFKDHNIHLNPYEFIGGRNYIAEKTGLSEKIVRTRIDKLITGKFIERASAISGNIVVFRLCQEAFACNRNSERASAKGQRLIYNILDKNNNNTRNIYSKSKDVVFSSPHEEQQEQPPLWDEQDKSLQPIQPQATQHNIHKQNRNYFNSGDKRKSYPPRKQQNIIRNPISDIRRKEVYEATKDVPLSERDRETLASLPYTIERIKLSAEFAMAYNQKNIRSYIGLMRHHCSQIEPWKINPQSFFSILQKHFPKNGELYRNFEVHLSEKKMEFSAIGGQAFYSFDLIKDKQKLLEFLEYKFNIKIAA